MGRRPASIDHSFTRTAKAFEQYVRRPACSRNLRQDKVPSLVRGLCRRLQNPRVVAGTSTATYKDVAEYQFPSRSPFIIGWMTPG